jgi:methionine synthase II (cobalamin-independent)
MLGVAMDDERRKELLQDIAVALQQHLEELSRVMRYEVDLPSIRKRPLDRRLRRIEAEQIVQSTSESVDGKP